MKQLGLWDSPLTPRQREIARLVKKGMTNKEIADRLGISAHTVKNCIFLIFDRLGFSNRVELALYADRYLHDEETVWQEQRSVTLMTGA